jgi:hypothetical protein
METTSPAPRPTDTDLAAEVRGLKSLFYLAVLALIVMGVSVNIYLGKQMRLARAQLMAQQRGMEDSERLLRNFVVAINTFASTNKDFQPVFDKYRPVFSKYIGGATPAASGSTTGGTPYTNP